MQQRATPEEMLRKIKLETKSKMRGHLKIFFGYAAGVGKTYAMLKSAHSSKKRGIDVIVGYIEPHTRPKTAQLLSGLEQLPTKAVTHNNINLNEFDLDKALKRKPQLILVDELAHSNNEECRHKKRYQDIEELLNEGIDVYTTINVQHIESLNDIVASITGIVVRERIPDHVFDNADQVELVDIEPEELIERLNNGEIYKDIRAQKALEHFFSVENLVALREIALRRTADRINRISEKVKQPQGNDYFTDEHILVCLSSSPSNAKIIRTASRMAKAFNGFFTALFVETSSFQSMSEQDKSRLRKNIHLAQQLGANIETAYGDDIALQIIEFSRLAGVSKIVLGRSNLKRRYFFGKPPLTDQLITHAPNLDIYIIPEKSSHEPRQKRGKRPRIKILFSDVLKSIGILIIATFLGFLFTSLKFSEANIITVYIMGVLITAIITTRRIYSIASSAISVLIFNFFFTSPLYTLNVYDSGYPITFIIMFIAAFLTGSLASKIKRQAKQSAQTAYRTKILLETNLLLQEQNEKQGIINVTSNQLVKLLKKSIVFYNAENDALSEPQIFNYDEELQTDRLITKNENAVANWVYKNNKHAGATTNTLSNAKCLYLAVRVPGKVLGVVGIFLDGSVLEEFENNIMRSIIGECGLALEKDFALRQREEAATLAKNEQLRANLLRSISHDLRTPLTSISGNAGILLSNEENLNKEKKIKLYSDIYDDSLWLINLVENLLSVTRIEDGTMALHLQVELINEVITEALCHINRKSSLHTIKINQPSDEFIFAKMDPRLIMQVIINIVDNAIKYTPEHSTITINTKKENKKAIVEISDDGNGLSADEKSKIFDMFFTANNNIADSRRSLGLGLALCKSIITAHSGTISVSDNSPKGTVFTFTLPTEEVTLRE